MRKTIFSLIMSLVILIGMLTGCAKEAQPIIIDYGDAESFEAALGRGENLEGKVVQFLAKNLEPQSAYGYNIMAGEHLNFVSSRNPDIAVGSEVVVRVTTIESVLGSWIIQYEKVDNAVSGDSTIISTQVETPAESSQTESEAPVVQEIQVESQPESVPEEESAESIIIDYGNAEAFEAALNAGENLEGKIVRFHINEFHPDSALGYNLWAGEHLNFVSATNPDIQEGDVVVRALTIENLLGSWVISYERVDNAVDGESTIYLDSGASNTDSEGNTSSTEPLQIELVDYGCTMVSSGYVYYGVILHNPNENIAIEFPSFRVTARDADGVILGTEDQTLSIIYPGEQIAHGFLGFKVDETPSSYEVQILPYKDYNVLRQSQFEPTEAMEAINFAKRDSKIVGEINNPNDRSFDSVCLTVIYRDSDGKIVCGDSTFVSDVAASSTTPFEISVSSEMNDYEFELYVSEW